MTFREKLQQEHPEKIGDHNIGGCCKCPGYYGYEECNKTSACIEYRLLLDEDASEYELDALCRKCWDREMPEQRESKYAEVGKSIAERFEAGITEPLIKKDVLLKMLAKNEESTAGDMVNSPNHYNAGGYECWDVMEAVFGPEAVYHFSLCNAFKYLFRAGKKDDLVQDLRKAIVYLEKAIEVKEKQKNDGERN